MWSSLARSCCSSTPQHSQFDLVLLDLALSSSPQHSQLDLVLHAHSHLSISCHLSPPWHSQLDHHLQSTSISISISLILTARSILNWIETLALSFSTEQCFSDLNSHIFPNYPSASASLIHRPEHSELRISTCNIIFNSGLNSHICPPPPLLLLLILQFHHKSQRPIKHTCSSQLLCTRRVWKLYEVVCIFNARLRPSQANTNFTSWPFPSLQIP